MVREHWTITVYGHVQGVFFRKSAREQGAALGIAITATNQPDGSVRIEAVGESEALEQFRAWCMEGPPRSRVDSIDVRVSNVPSEPDLWTK